jgi:RNA polymerase sigma factor (sigma-70 family)
MPPQGDHQSDDLSSLVELLIELHQIPLDEKARRKAIENKILTLVDAHLRDFLRTFLSARYPAMGESGAARFTAMLNDFFIKVLERRPDGFWRAQSAEELRRFISVALTHQMIDVLRREHRYQRPKDGLDELVEERKTFFEDKTGLEFAAEVLRTVQNWCESDDPTTRLRGLILRHRYVDGMTRKQIATHLGVTEHTVRTEHDNAIRELTRLYA